MGISNYTYNPDYAVPPGWVLEEHIGALGLSPMEFAARCGLPTETVSDILSGQGQIDSETAKRFGRETSLDETVWSNMEVTFRGKLAELGQDDELAKWARKFPVKELVKRGDLTERSLQADEMARMLSFFDVWSVGALHVKYGEASVAYRHSPSFESSRPELATWLRLGEIEAEQTDCPEYDRKEFLTSLQNIRTLTASRETGRFERARNLCLQAGVVLLFVKPFPKVALSGLSRWLPPHKPVVQLSARHKTDDHLWYSLFHEAAHILLHDTDLIFVDGIRGKSADGETEESKAEAEADKWAQDFLVPRPVWNKFAGTFLGSAVEVREFADEQGIAPGIVVGRLQRDGLLDWSRLNSLKRRLVWTES